MLMKKKNALVISIIYHVALFNNGVLCVSSQFHIFNIGSRIASDAYIESRAKYTYFLRHFSSILSFFFERTEIQKQKIIYKIKEKSVTQQNQYKFISCRFFYSFLFFLVWMVLFFVLLLYFFFTFRDAYVFIRFRSADCMYRKTLGFGCPLINIVFQFGIK